MTFRFRLSLLLQLLWIILLLCFASSQSNETTTHNDGSPNTDYSSSSNNQTTTHTDISEPGDAVIFPWFVLGVGSIIFLLITRYYQWLPYTACLFVFGTIAGVVATRTDTALILHISMVDYWIPINSEVILLVFLPGLVFKDSFGLDVHLFQVAFWQCFLFAFPMVLAGMYLTALVCYFIFPYSWSWNLCLTVGSIVSATDPVAVAALLDALGAPPRLKIHIGGESLLNDGSAMVFYLIFSQMFLLELGYPGIGASFDVASGFGVFFRMSLGGMAIGVAFAVCTILLLHLLNRRLNREENVVQVGTLITAAYLCYFVADVVAGTSGVIATLTLGVCCNAFAHATINDRKLLDDCQALIEHMLNTVLFALGGLVWGSIIANTDSTSSQRYFSGRDWAYLIVFYVFLTLIRFFLVGAFYPVTASIGLGSNFEEAVFTAYGGLRGAVGIALAISLDNTVREASGSEEINPLAIETNRVFGFVGGIAFLTLCINATLAGPLLKYLGLTKPKVIRQSIIKGVTTHVRAKSIDKMVELLSRGHFDRVNFAVIRHHLPLLADMTVSELISSAKRYQAAHNYRKDYRAPNLKLILQYVRKDDQESGSDTALTDFLQSLALTAENAHELRHTHDPQMPIREQNTGTSLTETRRLFLETVRGCYELQVEEGFLSQREFLVHSLYQSLDIAGDLLKDDKPLDDWEYTNVLNNPLSLATTKCFNRTCFKSCMKCFGIEGHGLTNEQLVMRYNVARVVAFEEAHSRARHLFNRELAPMSAEMTANERIVLEESEKECERARLFLELYPRRPLEVIISHMFCSTLLNFAVKHISHLVASKILELKEAEEMYEHIQELLRKLDSCTIEDHPGEFPMGAYDFHPAPPTLIKDHEPDSPIKSSLSVANAKF